MLLLSVVVVTSDASDQHAQRLAAGSGGQLLARIAQQTLDRRLGLLQVRPLAALEQLLDELRCDLTKRIQRLGLALPRCVLLACLQPRPQALAHLCETAALRLEVQPSVPMEGICRHR